MAKKKEATNGKSVITTAKLKSCTVGIHADKLVFMELNFTAEDNEVITELVKNEDDVLVTFGIPKDWTFGDDANWPEITSNAKLKASKISKTCDNPILTGLQFSAGQVEQVTNLIRAEQEIRLSLTQVQGQLQFQQEVRSIDNL